MRALTNNPADAATAAESSNERTAVWVDTLTQLPHFKDAAVQALVLQGLAAALMRETLFGVMAAYLQFLCAHAHDEAALAVVRLLVCFPFAFCCFASDSREVYGLIDVRHHVGVLW